MLRLQAYHLQMKKILPCESALVPSSRSFRTTRSDILFLIMRPLLHIWWPLDQTSDFSLLDQTTEGVAVLGF